ncbi:MAG: hypothetical protein JWO44_2226 [Bacteroidetes bacterium]|nr:hypothetical protein [Bacteroidota bacterium]
MLTKLTFLASLLFALNVSLHAGCGGPHLYSDRGGDCPHGGITYGPGFITGNPDTVLSSVGTADTIHFSLYSDPDFCPPMDSVRWFRDGILIYTAPPGAHNYFQFAAAGPGTYTCKFNYWGMPAIYSITFSPATGISSLASDEPALSVYPNPSTNGIYTLNTAVDESYTIRVVDISGRIVYELNGNEQQITLDLSDYTPGFYSLVYTNANGRKRVKKLVYD